MLPPGCLVKDLESSHKTLSAFGFYRALKGRWAYALWDNAGKPNETVTRTDISLILPEFRIIAPMYIDLITGAVYRIPDAHIRFNGSTAMLQAIPIWDAPVVLTDRSLVELE